MIFRMNIRRTKGLVWTLNIAAILCITLTFAMIYKKRQEGVFKPRKNELILKVLQRGINTRKEEGRSGSLNINDYSAIWKAPISGEKPKPVVEGGPEKVETPEVDSLDSVLSVQWIFKSDDPKESRVRLAYLDEPEDTELHAFTLGILTGEGDPLKSPYDQAPYNGKVVKIEVDRVVFSFKGEEVVLTPPFAGEETGERLKGEGAPALPSKVVRTAPPPPPDTQEIEPGRWLLSVKETQYVRKNWERELDLMTVSSMKNPRTGKTELRLTDLKPGSLAARRGFQKGDTLISINGVPIHTKAQAINYVKEHPELTTYVVKIDRMGKIITKTFQVPKE